MARKNWTSIAGKVFGREAVHHEEDGQFAFVTPCRELHVSLFPTMEKLNVVKRRVNKGGCGGDCNPSLHFRIECVYSHFPICAASAAIPQQPIVWLSSKEWALRASP